MSSHYDTQSSVLSFTRAIFSQEEVRYKSVASLSDDILRLAQKTANSINTTGGEALF